MKKCRELPNHSSRSLHHYLRQEIQTIKGHSIPLTVLKETATDSNPTLPNKAI